MKDLDKNRRYYLNDLDDCKLEKVLNWLKKEDYKEWCSVQLEEFKKGLDRVLLYYSVVWKGWGWMIKWGSFTDGSYLFEDESEVRVYMAKSTIKDLSDGEFMEVAEQQGAVFSLKGFEDYLNSSPKIDLSYTKFRFI